MKQDQIQFSPDRHYRISFYNPIEPKMGMNMSRFRLNVVQTTEITDFDPLWAVGWDGDGISWDSNSRYFSLQICDPTNAFFIYDIPLQKFASVHFNNVWVLAGHCQNDYIEIEFRDDQVPERKEHNQYPTKNYSKPGNLIFRFVDLKWNKKDELQKFKDINKESIIFDLQPIDNGWREFKGKLPISTELITVWTLREFAKYGDLQSKEWLEEIQENITDINFSYLASKYLGKRERR